jgi:hypothetical protein
LTVELRGGMLLRVVDVKFDDSESILPNLLFVFKSVQNFLKFFVTTFAIDLDFLAFKGRNVHICEKKLGKSPEHFLL